MTKKLRKWPKSPRVVGGYCD